MTAGQIARMTDDEVLDVIDAHPNPGAMARLNADLAAAPSPVPADVHPAAETDDELIEFDSNGLA